ncbi:SusC/RagA family TonB-linked outer membrane protein [Flexithrix dorotheae]|uniref:SusC/RagA family TonB-linked outer membrane protein n=1 Tax=Flexithrix dorotheae TaxID=70993 RepID=UPI000378216C|nr:TonB-dependent receptor [Flexithrix dorotheae]
MLESNKGLRGGRFSFRLCLYIGMLSLLVLLNSKNLLAQQSANPIKISGQVTSEEDGDPLPGVSILIKGTNTGTTTNLDGNFTLSAPENSTLQFSFIGFQTQEVELGSKTNLNIALVPDMEQLDEVVVVGYGTQKKGNLTGAVGVTKGDVLENRPVVNVTDGLQGVVPGLNITPANGAPGSGASINIRGATSINGGSPLVLIDGAQMDINSINPQDIESITVLKDAASASIYGARAAFGVILVTTKKGSKTAKPKISYSGNYFVAQPTILPEKSNSYRYAQYVNSMVSSTNASAIFNAEHLGLIQDRVEGRITNDYTLKPAGNAYYEHANTNWADLVFADAAPGQNHNISISGGTEKSAYRASFAYTKNDGVVKIGNDSYKRYNFNTNLSTDLNNWLTARFQVNFARAENDLHNLPPGHGPSIFHTVWRARPTLTPTFDIEGVPYPTFIRMNPVATLEQGGRNKVLNYNLNTKAGLEMKFGNFKVFSNFTYNPRVRQTVSNNVEFESVIPWGNLDVRTDGGPSYIRKINEIDNYYAFDVYGKYEKDWQNGHSLSATLGFNQEKATFGTDNIYNTDLISYDVISISNTLGDPIISDNYQDWALRSGFARLNYSFMGKYLLEVNGRYDGSSRFSKEDRFGFFPSVSAGWRLSDENFMQNVKIINLLKLRGSYGSLGNQNSSVLYPMVGYNTISQVNWAFDGTRPLGITPGNPLGANRTWETVSTTNFGVDVMILEGRLDATFDIYKRVTENMLVSGDALPGVYGATAPQKNAADLEVKGWEFSIGWNDQIGTDFKYNFNVVLSDSKGEITRFDNPTKSLARSYYEGQTIGELWGYETMGLFQSQDEIDAAADQTPLGAGNLVAPGDVRYADLNNDNAINIGENTVENPGDRKIIGNSSPRYLYGIRSGFDWKGFDLGIFFQGVGKRDYWLDGPLMFGGVGNYGNVVVTDYLYENTWSDGSDGLPANTDAYYFRPSQAGVVGRNTNVQTRYLQDASYLRLKNLTIGYSIPASTLEKIGVGNLRVYFSGENLLTFTKLNENFDPETLSPDQGALGNTSFGNGGSQSGKLYPLSKRVSFGLTVGF